MVPRIRCRGINTRAAKRLASTCAPIQSQSSERATQRRSRANRFAGRVERSDKVLLTDRDDEMGWNPYANVPATTATLQIFSAAHRWLRSPQPR